MGRGPGRARRHDRFGPVEIVVMQALEGLLVVSLEQAVAAPLATSRLVDGGARVIKLERNEGDAARHYDDHAAGHSSYFVWLNRGKESCRVDLAMQNDRSLVLRMISKADVFIQNLGPGAAARMGLGSAHLRQVHPRLITCDISGYSPDTPHAPRKAYDLLIQAEAGLAAITGAPGSGPNRIGISVCDITTGLTAHAQILEALIRRAITGQGCAIALSLFDVAADLMSIPFIAAANGGPVVRQAGLAHPSIAPYGGYSTKTGSLLIAVQNDPEWASLSVGVLRQAHLATDRRFSCNAARVRNRAALDAAINTVFAEHSNADLIDRLNESHIAYGVVSTVADLLQHTALSRSSCSAQGVAIETVAGAWVVDGFRTRFGHVPELGEHDQSLRGEFS